MIRLSFFAWFFPILVSQNQIAFFFFNFGHRLHIIASVPTHHQGRPVTVRPFGRCFTPKCLCFFFARGARLQATALRAGHQTLASILREGTYVAPVLALGGGDFTVVGSACRSVVGYAVGSAVTSAVKLGQQLNQYLDQRLDLQLYLELYQ